MREPNTDAIGEVINYHQRYTAANQDSCTPVVPAMNPEKDDNRIAAGWILHDVI